MELTFTEKLAIFREMMGPSTKEILPLLWWLAVPALVWRYYGMEAAFYFVYAELALTILMLFLWIGLAMSMKEMAKGANDLLSNVRRNVQ